MTIDTDEIMRQINRDELVQLSLNICNIDSAGTNEAPVARFVAVWLKKEGFGVRKLPTLRLPPELT